MSVSQLPEMLLWIFLYFCRIGGMLMVFPGYASARVPVQVRLFLAVAVTAALSPMLLGLPQARPIVLGEATPATLLLLIVTELVKGVTIGLMARLILLALDFLLTAMTMYIGMGNFPGAPAEGLEPAPPLVNFLSLGAVILIFASGLHAQALVAVVESYAVSPVGRMVAAADSLADVVEKLSYGTWLAFQATAPFLVYGVIVNLAVGLVNRLTPQIPAYFIAVSAIMFGGLLLLFLIIDEMMLVFLQGFADWLAEG
jgi:flagellar biosynthetic protein FliR